MYLIIFYPCVVSLYELANFRKSEIIYWSFNHYCYFLIVCFLCDLPSFCLKHPLSFHVLFLNNFLISFTLSLNYYFFQVVFQFSPHWVRPCTTWCCDAPASNHTPSISHSHSFVRALSKLFPHSTVKTVVRTAVALTFLYSIPELIFFRKEEDAIDYCRHSFFPSREGMLAQWDYRGYELPHALSDTLVPANACFTSTFCFLTPPASVRALLIFLPQGFFF